MKETTIITLIAVPFLLITIILILREIYILIKCQKWPSIEGKVIDSGVIDGGMEEAYTASIKYEYEINGKRYKSRRIAFLRWWGSEKYAKKIIDKYSQNKFISIYYNPNKPKQSVIDKTPQISDIVLTIFIIAVIFYGSYLAIKENI